MPGPPPELRRGRNLNNRTVGDLGEEIARRYLAAKGYEIVESNYRTRRGELDLTSRQEDTLVFDEVKLRRGTAYGTPLEAVTPASRAPSASWPRSICPRRAPSLNPYAST